LNSLPKLESRTLEAAKPIGQFALVSLSLSLSLFFFPLFAPRVAYLRYRSQIQVAIPGVDISRARGAPRSFVPKCEVEVRARAGVDCRWIFAPRPFSSSFFPPFLFSLVSSRLQTSRETEAAWLAPPAGIRRATPVVAAVVGGGGDGCINIMQISGAEPVLHTARARPLRSSPLRGTLAPVDARSVVAYFQRDMHDSRVSLPYRPEIACTLHTRHNSTPNLLLRPPASLSLPSCALFCIALTYLSSSALSSACRALLLSTPSSRLYLLPSPLPLPCATSSRLRRPYVVVSPRFDLWRAPSFGTWKRAETGLSPFAKAFLTLTDGRGEGCVAIRSRFIRDAQWIDPFVRRDSA